MSDKAPDWAELVLSRIGQEFDGEAHFTEDEARQIASALLSAYRRGRENQQTEFVGWIRQWVKRRFGQWITYNTAKGAYADYQAAIRHLGEAE